MPLRSRSLVAALGLACGLAGALAPLALTTTSANAATADAFVIVGSRTGVTTTKGKRVTVSVSGFRGIAGGMRTVVPARASNSQLAIGISRAGESHHFGFAIPDSALSLSKSFSGKIAPGTDNTLPIAKLNLTATPRGAATTTKCAGKVTSRTQPLTLSGVFYLNTRSGTNGWGAVGSTTKPFSFSTTATATRYYDAGDCETPYPNPACESSTYWTLSSSAATLNGTGKRVTAIRTVNLTKPAGAARSDVRTATARSAVLTQNNETKTARLVITGNGGSIKGKAVLNGKNRSLGDREPCGTAGKKLRYASWYPATLASSRSPLTMKDIYGTMQVTDPQYVGLSRSFVTN